MSVSPLTKTREYTQWQCNECGQEFSTHHVAVECSEKHVYRGEFEVGEYFTFGQIVKIAYKRETISRILVQRWNEERKWISGWSAKHYHKKITDPENYRGA